MNSTNNVVSCIVRFFRGGFSNAERVYVRQVLSKQPLWNHLLNDYKDQRLLMEGPLSNLKESAIQFTKPRKLVNAANPGGRYMSTAMFDAREVLVPGGAYDRRGGGAGSMVGAVPGMVNQDGYSSGPPRRMGGIYSAADPRLFSTAATANFPVPVDYIMNFAMPAAYGGMMMPGAGSTAPGGGLGNRGGYGPPPRRGGGPPVSSSRTKSARYGGQSQTGMGMSDHGPLSASQDAVYSQGPLTQAAMMSQSYGGAFSQHGLGDLSQSDSIYLGGGAVTTDEFRSQADIMLSQDSTYQGDRAAGFFQSQSLSQPGFFPASQY